jgi:hypothetical protein
MSEPHLKVRPACERVAQFACHFQQSPESLGPEEIRTYQASLTTEWMRLLSLFHLTHLVNNQER